MKKPKADSLPIAVLLTALVGFGPVSTDLYLPSLPDMVRAFGTSVSMVQLTLSVFLIGFASMQLVYGPLSDRFGRRPVLLGGVAIYVVASLLCMLAPTIELLIVGRFFQAVGAASGPVLGRAIVRDVYGRERAAKVLSYMASAMALAPAIGPMIGGVLHVAFGWQANFIALTAFGAFLMLATFLMLEETNPHLDAGAISPARLLSNFGKLLSNRLFIGYTLCVGMAFGGLFSFISGSSFVLIDVMGVKPENFGFCFASVVFGYMSGTFLSGRIHAIWKADKIIFVGAIIGVVSGFLLLDLSAVFPGQFLAVLIPTSLFFMACGLIMPNGMAAAIGPFPQMAGTASSLLGFIQMGIGAFAGYMVGYLHNGTQMPMVAIITLCSVLSLTLYIGLVKGSSEK
jgi:DHA1 family bicyclomycin/chloramphenicol resistance-like MFS transporter